MIGRPRGAIPVQDIGWDVIENWKYDSRTLQPEYNSLYYHITEGGVTATKKYIQAAGKNVEFGYTYEIPVTCPSENGSPGLILCAENARSPLENCYLARIDFDSNQLVLQVRGHSITESKKVNVHRRREYKIQIRLDDANSEVVARVVNTSGSELGRVRTKTTPFKTGAFGIASGRTAGAEFGPLRRRNLTAVDKVSDVLPDLEDVPGFARKDKRIVNNEVYVQAAFGESETVMGQAVEMEMRATDPAAAPGLYTCIQTPGQPNSASYKLRVEHNGYSENRLIMQVRDYGGVVSSVGESHDIPHDTDYIMRIELDENAVTGILMDMDRNVIGSQSNPEVRHESGLHGVDGGRRAETEFGDITMESL